MKSFLLVDEYSRREFNDYLDSLDYDLAYQVEVKRFKTNRSIAQNALYWKWIHEMQQHVLETEGRAVTKEAIHEELKDLYLPKRVEESIKSGVKVIPGSTAHLSVGDFSEYLMKVEYFCEEFMEGIQLTHPEDLYQRAIGG